MAKKIISKDIIDEGIFTGITNDAEKLLVVVKGLKTEYKDFAKSLQTSVKNNPVNSAQAVKSFEDTAKAVDNTTKSLDKLNKAEKDLQKQRIAEIKLQQDREKAFDKFNKQQEKNFDLQKKQNSVYNQSVKRLSELKKELKELEITGRTNGKLYKALGQEFVVLNGKVRDAEEGVGEFFRNVGNYPQQLKAIQKELQSLDPSSARFQELAKRAGELKDRINDAKDATRAFASESKTQTAKTLFGQVLDDLKNLDFKGAADKAKQLASVLGSISFKEIIGGVKDFGTAIGNLGKALLANPFTLLAAALVSAGLAIKGFFDSVDAGQETLENLNTQLNEIAKSTASVSTDTKKLIIDQKVLTGVLSKEDAERRKLQLDFTEIYKKSLEEQRKATEEFNKKIQDERDDDWFKGTKALYEYFGGETNLTKRQKIGLANIEKEFNEQRKKETEKFQAQLRLITLSGNKTTIEKQLFDWQKFYDELDKLAASNNKDALQRDLENENIRFRQSLEEAKKQSKVITSIVTGADGKKKEIVDKLASDANYRKLSEQLEVEHQNNINRIVIERRNELNNITREINRALLEDQIGDTQLLADDFQKSYDEATQKILSTNEIFNAKTKEQREAQFELEKANIIALYELKSRLLNQTAKDEISNIKASNDDEKLKAAKILKINSKLKIDLENLRIDDLRKQSELNKKKAIEDEAIRIKDRKEILQTISEVTDKTFTEINRRKEAQIQAFDEEINNRKTNIERQEALAAQGLQNTLEFEKQKQAEAELERKRLAEEQEKREKRQVFFKALIASLENAKSNEEAIQSVARATAITAIAQTVAGFFKDGVENFKGKGTETSDSNLVAISKGESVVTAKATRTYEGLATAMNNGEVEKWIGKNYGEKQVASTYNPQLLLALRSVEKAIKEKDTVNINWDGHDTRVETLVRLGYKKTVKHVKGRTRI